MNLAVRAWRGPSDRTGYLRAIHALGRSLRLDDETRRSLQAQLVGVESAKHMTLAQMATIYQRLSALAKDAGLGKPKPRTRPGRDERLPQEPPTQEQLDKIEWLYADLHVYPSADMMALCRRITGHPWPQSREEGSKLIEGLKAMKARGWRAATAGPSERASSETGNPPSSAAQAVEGSRPGRRVSDRDLLRREDVLQSLDALLAQGYGELTVTVREGRIEQIETLIRKRRKVARAGELQRQV